VAARRLKEVLPEVNEADVRAKLTSERRFIWIYRNLTPRQQYAVNRLGIPGLSFQREARRVYPQGAMAAHVVGFTDVDGKGIAGIERSFDGALAAGTAPIDLSVDMRVQHAVVDELTAAIKDFNAVGGVGLVLDVRSGEVLALASLPDFDPNHPGDVKPEDRFNRATLGVYEMGSTFKTFVIAGALDSGTTTLKGGYDATNPIHIGRCPRSTFTRPISVPPRWRWTWARHSSAPSCTASASTSPARWRSPRSASRWRPRSGET
jgi:cell division protein FtsI (penicillin-binding protein 3)